jgi:hypothetical protein
MCQKDITVFTAGKLPLGQLIFEGTFDDKVIVQ